MNTNDPIIFSSCIVQIDTYDKFDLILKEIAHNLLYKINYAHNYYDYNDELQQVTLYLRSGSTVVLIFKNCPIIINPVDESIHDAEKVINDIEFKS